MKKAQIINNIKEKSGIAQLNAMQREMAETEFRDIILTAPTGSGKTLAFAIRMLRNVDIAAEGRTGVSAIVIAPSRELVLQIFEVIRPIAVGAKTVAFYGGHPMADEVNSLAAGLPDIVISTPGRLVDHLKRATVDISNVKSIVLDEFDKALELGFYDEMRRIVRQIRRPSLKILTSATYADLDAPVIGKDGKECQPLFNVADFHLFDFSGNVVEPTSSTDIYAVKSPSKDKLETLDALLRSVDNGKVIVFLNYRDAAERVYNYLKKNGFPVGLYHGGLEQPDRKLAVDLLANGTTPILVATDLAARGLDIPEVANVVHYHIPGQAQVWTHRNGRTARQGAEGRVYVILGLDENVDQYIDNSDLETIDAEQLVASDNPIHADWATVYFHAGRKEKLSKGDIAGFLMQKGGLGKDEVGKIIVDDHRAIAAVPASKLASLIPLLSAEKIKGKKVRITPLRP